MRRYALYLLKLLVLIIHRTSTIFTKIPTKIKSKGRLRPVSCSSSSSFLCSSSKAPNDVGNADAKVSLALSGCAIVDDVRHAESRHAESR